MISTHIPGVFKYKGKIFTKNLAESKGIKVYNEKIVNINGNEYRSWNPHRSKLAAALLKNLKKIEIKIDSNILYLGAATGTTVSHLSDIIKNGVIYAIENSPFASLELIRLCKTRKNIIPIFSNANNHEKYSYLIPKINFIYQDISQRNQADIFIKNIKKYLTENDYGLMMVKSRSIDVSKKPKKVYTEVIDKFKDNGLKIIEKVELDPYEKDHLALLISV